MEILKIKRSGLSIFHTGSLEPSQGSYDVPVSLENDDTYTDYTISMYVGYYVNGVLKKRKCETDSEGHYLIPGAAFLRSGIISISFLLETAGKSQGLMTNALSYDVKHAPNVAVEVPPDPTWQELVKEWIEDIAGSVSVDNTLTQPGKAADSKATGDAISQLYDEISNNRNPTDEQIDSAVTDYLNANPVTGGLTSTAKTLLITILKNGAYKTDQSTNITALASALATSSGGSSGGVTTYSIINSLTNVTSDNSTTMIVAEQGYTATLTLSDGYALDSVKVTMGGVDVTETVWNAETGVITIDSVTGDLLIIASAVESAGAVTSWLYHFDNDLYAVGEKDFGLTFNPTATYTTPVYEDGMFGKSYKGYSNYGASLSAQELTDYPILDGDFTIAVWGKNSKLANNNYILSTAMTSAWLYNKTSMNPTLVDTENWTMNNNTGRSSDRGIGLLFGTTDIVICLVSSDEVYGQCVTLTTKNELDLEWHHYALTRSGSTVMFFFDGKLVVTLEYAGELYSSNQIILNGYVKNSGEIISGYFSIDELLIDDTTCRYTEDFDVPTAPYIG